MKILIVGDTHFSDRRPERRTDADYFGTQLNKFTQIIQIYNEEDCQCMIQVGDFFNSPHVSNYVISSMIDILRENGIIVYCVYGQHDIVGHTGATFRRSPLAVLQSSGQAKLLSQKGCMMEDNTVLYGAPFGETFDESVVDKDQFNVLVVHDMIGSADLYPGQNITQPKSFLEKYKRIGLICCGDYHYSFINEVGERTILNPGALVRKTIGEMDLAHKPKVMLYNTRNKKTKEILLKFESAKHILNCKKVSKVKNDEMEDFIESIRKKKDVSVSWKTILQNVYEKRKTRNEVKQTIDKCLEEICCG